MSNNFIWCYKKDCKYFLYAAEDRGGKFGSCGKEEIIIDKNGKCKSEKPRIEEDKDFDMIRETGDYIGELGNADRFVKDCPGSSDCPVGVEDDGEY